MGAAHRGKLPWCPRGHAQSMKGSRDPARRRGTLQGVSKGRVGGWRAATGSPPGGSENPRSLPPPPNFSGLLELGAVELARAVDAGPLVPEVPRMDQGASGESVLPKPEERELGQAVIARGEVQDLVLLVISGNAQALVVDAVALRPEAAWPARDYCPLLSVEVGRTRTRPRRRWPDCAASREKCGQGVWIRRASLALQAGGRGFESPWLHFRAMRSGTPRARPGTRAFGLQGDHRSVAEVIRLAPSGPSTRLWTWFGTRGRPPVGPFSVPPPPDEGLLCTSPGTCGNPQREDRRARDGTRGSSGPSSRAG